ncbi:MAG: flagellar basal body rod protein FlgC [Candidatus Eisenbacteria bacterium]|nr:flagellar basal body rod protein FlgC [Candidatus Eisenbacteria bacterium]
MRVGGSGSMEVSARALAAFRRQMDVVAENLANSQTTRTETGEPYRRREVVFRSDAVELPAEGSPPPPAAALNRTLPEHLDAVSSAAPGGIERLSAVAVDRVAEDPSPFPEVYDPSHPDADENGIVRYPNVDAAKEMVNLVLATRAYEANVAALTALRQIHEATLQMGRSA